MSEHIRACGSYDYDGFSDYYKEVEQLGLFHNSMFSVTEEELTFACRGLHPPGNGAAVLDFGCGIGETTVRLSTLYPNARVIGADPSRELLAIAERTRRPNLEFLRIDPSQPALGDGCYALIYCAFVLQHLPDPRQKLAMLRRALCPGGAIVIREIDVSLRSIWPVTDRWQRSWERILTRRKALGGDPCIGGKLGALLHSCGYQEIDVKVGIGAEPFRDYGAPACLSRWLGILSEEDRQEAKQALEELDAFGREEGAYSYHTAFTVFGRAPR